MTPPNALVRKGRRPPRPKTRITSDDPAKDSPEIMRAFRAQARAELVALAAAESDEQAAADVERVITQAKAAAQDVLEDDHESDQWRRDQARRLSGLVWGLEKGRKADLSGSGAERYLRAAIEIGAIMTDLGAYYWRPPHRPPSWTEDHFEQLDGLDELQMQEKIDAFVAERFPSLSRIARKGRRDRLRKAYKARRA